MANLSASKSPVLILQTQDRIYSKPKTFEISYASHYVARREISLALFRVSSSFSQTHKRETRKGKGARHKNVTRNDDPGLFQFRIRLTLLSACSIETFRAVRAGSFRVYLPAFPPSFFFFLDYFIFEHVALSHRRIPGRVFYERMRLFSFV